MVKLNGNIIGQDCFPNNERILKSCLSHSTEFEIEINYHTDIDISTLIMVKKYLDDVYPNSRVVLVMKYIPYSRMDRNITGFVFTLKYFCQLINELKFHSVYVLDPHSNVSTALLERCKELNVQILIEKVIYNHIDVDYVFYPDNGACKRYSEIIKLPNYIPYFYGNKKRNLQTGEILEYELVNCPDLKEKNVLIIDDLCAKGFTFYNAGLRLKEQGAKNVYLYVSHCENSIYQGQLIKSNLISKIFTTDSILTDWSSDLIEELK